nr:S24 family peptidase [Streptococcus infantis]
MPHDFATWVVGDSMEPELPDGDVVLIKQSTNVEDR